MSDTPRTDTIWTDEEMAALNAVLAEKERTIEFWRNMALQLKDEMVQRGDDNERLRAELAETRKPLLTMDEVNSLDTLVGDSDKRDEKSAMEKLKSLHCTYETRHDCYGELWECAECGDIHCCIEGGDTDVELCDSCWSEKTKEGEQ